MTLSRLSLGKPSGSFFIVLSDQPSEGSAMEKSAAEHISDAKLPLDIDVVAAQKLLEQDPQALLLDCRTLSEHALAQIGRAKLIPMDQLAERVSELDEYRNRPVIVHCHHGGRSQIVTQWLRRQGFHLAQNMAGGIDDWSQQIDDSVLRY